ncbi:MAG: D-aminoacyl-tRNA deacylase [Candidatus Micrarchaeota archaeon]
MPTIFCSTADKASSNVAKFLKENHGFQPAGEVGGFAFWRKGNVHLVELKTRLVESDFLGGLSFPESDLFVFASKHQAESGKPCYTAHAPGNWGASTPFGGNPGELQLTSARALACLKEFLQDEELPFAQEATHHGPTSLKVPTVFVEVGSTEKEWVQEKLAEPVAEAIVKTCSEWTGKKAKAALGFGGTHYCNAFQELPFSFSHVASKHSLDSVDSSIVKQAIEKTVEPVEKAFLDWKGCNKTQRDKLIACFEQLGLKWERV